MITATTPSLPSSQNPIPLASCPPPATMFQLQLRPTATSSEQFASSLLLHCKDHPNVFNTIQPLFSAFFSANPLFSTTSSLFFAKQGGGGHPCFQNSLAGRPTVCHSQARYPFHTTASGNLAASFEQGAQRSPFILQLHHITSPRPGSRPVDRQPCNSVAAQ